MPDSNYFQGIKEFISSHRVGNRLVTYSKDAARLNDTIEGYCATQSRFSPRLEHVSCAPARGDMVVRVGIKGIPKGSKIERFSLSEEYDFVALADKPAILVRDYQEEFDFEAESGQG